LIFFYVNAFEAAVKIAISCSFCYLINSIAAVSPCVLGISAEYVILGCWDIPAITCWASPIYGTHLADTNDVASMCVKPVWASLLIRSILN
jgi:hypothetical protein